MSLNCAITMNVGAYSAGQTPPPMATLTVYNPNAVAVVVTSVQVYASSLNSPAQTLAMAPVLPPIGPGQNNTVPALGSINIGPFPIALRSVAYVAGASPVVTAPSAFLAPMNPQGSQPAQYIAQINATVYGSDGSVNVAAPGALLVSHSFSPPLGSQGGFLNFASPQNSCGFVPGWP